MDEIVKALEQIIEDQVDQRTRELYWKWSCANSNAEKYAKSLRLVVDEFNLEDKIQEKKRTTGKKYNDAVYADSMNGEGRPSASTNRAEDDALQWNQVVRMLQQTSEPET